ncbi:MAG: YdcF family protein, partial [Bifidobacterium crudilactis]|nr:YdcF family protein [Bifidobacterium crudilactis]
MEILFGQILIYGPVAFFGLLFLFSYLREPRQFRNAIYLTIFLILLATCLLFGFGQEWMVLPVLLAVVACPVVVVLFLIWNSVLVIRHEGLSMSTALPAVLAVVIVMYLVMVPLLSLLHAPAWLNGIASLIVFEGLWFFFSFVALLVYSWFYRLLPRKRHYDYIIVHGAGLDGTKPTPLLRGRLETALRLWNRQGRSPLLIVSGGQGADEEVSEAAAMKAYLVNERQVPESSVLSEDKSTTTLENLRFSKQIMDAHSGGARYRCALVTSDYHVFRAAEYAHKVGVSADGVGSHT